MCIRKDFKFCQLSNSAMLVTCCLSKCEWLCSKKQLFADLLYARCIRSARVQSAYVAVSIGPSLGGH